MPKLREYPTQRSDCLKYQRRTNIVVTGMRCNMCEVMQPSTNFRVGQFKKDGTPVQHVGCFTCLRHNRAWRIFVNALETATGLPYGKIVAQARAA